MKGVRYETVVLSIINKRNLGSSHYSFMDIFNLSSILLKCKCLKHNLGNVDDVKTNSGALLLLLFSSSSLLFCAFEVK